ncbi:VOC family protein [Pararhizobium mangrovi]|uniref:VOC family protein n=2 Tax=Pararhizobium mangrovi TaxID=2590452 RepID=A0A506TZW2_9HYPH|nr:VOC family protein [Pararhizobium mangrovi]
MDHTKAFNAALKEIAAGGSSEVSELSPLAREKTAAEPFRAIDHLGVTVPDLPAAARFFEQAFGASTLYEVKTPDEEPQAGREAERQLGLTEGTKIVHMRLMRLGDGPCLELFQIADGEQRPAPQLQDLGLTHFGLYVDDMDAAIAAFENAGGELLEGPHPLAAVEDKGDNAGIYGRAPWGMLIEFLTYPDGIDYPNDAPTIRWTPRP